VDWRVHYFAVRRQIYHAKVRLDDQDDNISGESPLLKNIWGSYSSIQLLYLSRAQTLESIGEMHVTPCPGLKFCSLQQVHLCAARGSTQASPEDIIKTGKYNKRILIQLSSIPSPWYGPVISCWVSRRREHSLVPLLVYLLLIPLLPLVPP
jgi:hypothetical protein